MVDAAGVGQLGRVVDVELGPVGEEGPVLHARRGGDEGEVELALEPLAHDLHVQQAEEAAAEADAEGVGRLGLEGEAGVVELELVQGVAQVGQLVAVDRVEAAEHHGLGVPVAGQRLGGAVLRGGDRLARAGLADVLDPGDEVAHLARAEPLHRDRDGRAHAHLFDVVHRVGLHEAQARPGVQRAVDDPDGAHDAPVLVVGGVEDQGPQRTPSASPWGGGMRAMMASSSSGTPSPVLAEMCRMSSAGQPQHVLDLERAALRVGRRQVDLVEDRHDLEVVLNGLVAVGQRLGLDALGGVDQEHRSLAGGQRAGHLVAEVDVAGGVDQVEDVTGVHHPDVLGLDGDPALPLDVHGVEVLLPHEPGVDGAR